MIAWVRTVAVAFVAVAILAACGGGPRRPMGTPPPPTDLEQNIRLMLSYDANSDGKVTRDELEQGLRRQFMAADRNGDGFLDQAEVQAENDRRYAASGTGFTPLIDWNRDGKIDFAEFALTARSVFEEMEKDHNGVLEGESCEFLR